MSFQDQNKNQPGMWVRNRTKYTYDMAGNIASIGQDQHYYDALSRLVHSTLGNAGIYDIGFAFDAFGNMTSQKVTPAGNIAATIERTYTTDWQTNRLTQQAATGAQTVGYAYNANGNMVADDLKTAGGRALVFDGQGRLREVVHPEKGRIGSYDYDAAGYRVRVEADGNETYLFRDASGQVLSEYQRPVGSNTDPVWNKDYIYAFGKSFALARNRMPPAPPRPYVYSMSPTGSPTSITIKWDPASVPDLYRYTLTRRYKNGTAVPYTIVPSEHPEWTDQITEGVDANTYITYTLTAKDTAGNWSNPGPPLVVFPGNQSLPPSPSNITATPGDTSVTIRWDPPTLPHNDLWGYNVERGSRESGGPAYVKLNSTPITASSFVDTPLINGATYWYHVRTVDTAGRQSFVSFPPVAADAHSAKPNDSVPPGKIFDVFAEPDRAAGKIKVSWKRGADADVKWYRVFRGTALGTITTQIGGNLAASSAESYDVTDPAAAQNQTNFYTVVAVDTTGNASAPSEPVSARPRTSESGAPVITSVSYTVANTADNVTDGMPGSRVDFDDTGCEANDVMQAVVNWHADVSHFGYRVYRLGPGEAHFLPVSDRLSASTTSYVDSSITKGDYTYFVAGVLNAAGDEVAADTLQTNGLDVFFRHVDYPTEASVRNVVVYDGRDYFTTDNKESRLAVVQWSRVVEPDLLGYNVYRMCDWWESSDGTREGMEHFACEASWIRLNATPLSAERHSFGDSSTGGLQGVFSYAVRPVSFSGAEGKIGKIVIAGLGKGAHTGSSGHSKAAESFVHWTNDAWWNPGPCATACADLYPPRYGCQDPVPLCDDKTVNYVLNESPAAGDPPNINGMRRTGSPNGSPPQPSQVKQYILVKQKDVHFIHADTGFARVTWTMGYTPSDLQGFHIETAGSPQGPWRRLTTHPVAWWERSYVAQGVSTPLASGEWSGHTDCLRYRVIAVDEAGNESIPGVAVTDQTPNAVCPTTPDPPKHLRASSLGTELLVDARIRLEWDPSTTGATEYYVYRTVINPLYPNFYQTQRVGSVTPNSPPNVYIETGGDVSSTNNPDYRCGIINGGDSGMCALGHLEAYYVTARGVLGGESPRSNLVFWKWGANSGGGYLDVLNEKISGDALASFDVPRSNEFLACWITDQPNLPAVGGVAGDSPVPGESPALATAPMLRLGQASPPPWVVYDLHTDHLGSVRAITNSVGALVSRHDYFPFGVEIQQGTISYNTHQFTGHERDQATQLDYMLARYYEGEVGRFISVDPVAFKKERLVDPQRLNLLSYVANNPLRYLDRTGKDISVFYVSPGSGGAKESAGHSAVYATSGNSAAGLSYGGKHGFENGKEAFVKAYTDEGRTVTEFKLKSTPAQDSKAVGFIKANPDGGVDHNAIGADKMVTQNCTTAVGNTLSASGIVAAGQSPPGSGVLDTPAKLKSDLEEGGSHEGLVETETVNAPTKPDEKKNDAPNKDTQ